jgi:hypothetical protein
MLNRLRDRIGVLAGGIGLLLGAYLAPDPPVPPVLAQAAYVLGGALAAWGLIEIAVGIVSSLLDGLARWQGSPRLRVHPIAGQALSVPAQTVVNCSWIEVTNDATRPQGDALDVFATIEIVNPLTGRVVIPRVTARWRDSPRPQDVPDVGEISDRKEIRASQSRQLDVVFKEVGETTAHFLNTDAMQYPAMKKPGWELPEGMYDVTLRLSGRNIRPRQMRFRLANLGTYAPDLIAAS